MTAETLVELHLILGGLGFQIGCLAGRLVLLVVGLVGDLLELLLGVAGGFADLVVFLGDFLGRMLFGALGALLVTVGFMLLDRKSVV